MTSKSPPPKALTPEDRQPWITSANSVMTSKHDKEISAINYHTLMDQIDMLAEENKSLREDAGKMWKWIYGNDPTQASVHFVNSLSNSYE